MVTIKEIAESLNVSTATVSNVIHGHLHKMSPAMVQRIRDKLEEYQYIPNMGARMLAKGDSEIIGVITNYPNREEKLALQDPFVSELIGALENEIRTHHFFTLLYAAQNAQEINHLAQTWNTQGMIIMGLQADQCRELMQLSPATNRICGLLFRRRRTVQQRWLGRLFRWLPHGKPSNQTGAYTYRIYR